MAGGSTPREPPLVAEHLAGGRLSAQLLAGPPAKTAVQVVERLLAVQAQDPRGFRLAIRARSAGLSAADVERALTTERSLVVTWLNRGTLHLVRSEDYWWLHALTTPPVATANARRLRQEGVSPEAAEKAVEVIERSLSQEGPLTRAQLRERVAAAGIRVEGQALVHQLLLATLRGLIVRGPVVAPGGEQAFVLVRDWLGAPPPLPDGGAALGELARRYLAGHGPATARDLAKWAGLPLGDARRGLDTIGPALVHGADGLVDLAGRRHHRRLPAPRLLGPFDPLLLGWTSRELVLGAHTSVVTRNGMFRPIALVMGRAVATWTMPGGQLALSPLEPLDQRQTTALHRDATEVTRFLAPAGSVP